MFQQQLQQPLISTPLFSSASSGAPSSSSSLYYSANSNPTTSTLTTPITSTTTTTSTTNPLSLSTLGTTSLQQQQQQQQQNAQQQENKQYIPSRFFVETKNDLISSTDKRKTLPESIMQSPPSHIHYGQQSSPSTPYNHSFRSGVMAQSPSDSFRYRVGAGVAGGYYGGGSLNNTSNSGYYPSMIINSTSGSTTTIDKDYIPKASIYDEPTTSSLTSSIHQGGASINQPGGGGGGGSSYQFQPNLSFYDAQPTGALAASNQQSQINSLQHQLVNLQHQSMIQPNTPSIQSQIQQTTLQLSQLQQQQQQLYQQQQNQGLTSSVLQTSSTPILTSSQLYTSQSQQQQQQQQQPFVQQQLALYNSTSPYLSQTADSSQLYSEKYDKRWLTIFGFPLSASDLVLDEIGSTATIVETKYPASNTSNWMHIKLENESIASDLLSKNGTIIGNYMIGISPYKDITKSAPLPAPKSQPPFKELESYAPSKSAYDPSEYLNNSSSNPTQATRPSIMSKISEYVFGI